MSARRLATLVALVSVLALWSGQSPAGACACGIAIQANVSEERALVIERSGSEEIILSLDLASVGPQPAAVVLPVPREPEVAAVEGGDPLDYLDEATAPPVTTAPGGGDEGAAATGAVDVIGREEIGGYDVSRLAANDPRALQRWLSGNGYELPAAAEPILAEYVAEGWSYVAIRLSERADGRLRPLRVSFPTEEFVYPMRLAQLGTVPIALTLYVLADGPREVSGLEGVFGGAVAELDPQPPAALDEIFSQGSYVSRLEVSAADPAGFTTDLVVEPARQADDVGAAAGVESQASEDDGASAVAIVFIALGGVALAALLWFVVSGRLRSDEPGS